MDDREQATKRSTKLQGIILAHNERLTKLIKPIDHVVEFAGINSENIAKCLSHSAKRTHNGLKKILDSFEEKFSTTLLGGNKIVYKIVKRLPGSRSLLGKTCKRRSLLLGVTHGNDLSFRQIFERKSMPVNSHVNKLLDLRKFPSGCRKTFNTTGVNISISSIPNLVNDLLIIGKDLTQFFSIVLSIAARRSKIRKRLNHHLGRNLARSDGLLERSIILNQLVERSAISSGRIYAGKLLLEFFNRSTSFIKLRSKLAPATLSATHSGFDNVITSIREVIDNAGEHARQLSPERLRFLEVTENKLPCLGPARSHGLLESIHELSKSLNLRSSVNRGVSKLNNILGLLLRISLSNKIGLSICARKLSKRLGKNLSRKPLTTSKRLSE